MDRPGGEHDLQTGLRDLVVDVFQVVDGLVLRVGELDVADELLGVGIVAEPDERAGVVPRHDHVVAFVLPSQLVEVFLVVTGSRMDLDRHVAVAVVRVVVVEADREVAVEFLYAGIAHDGLAFALHEGEEGEFDPFGPGLDDDADLHRDQVEDPGAVAHGIGQVAQFLDIGAAPDSLQVDGLAAERIGGQRSEHLLHGLPWQQVYAVVVVGGDIVVEHTLLQKFAAQVYGHFEIHVVAASDDEVGRAGRPVAQVGVFTAPDAQDRLLGGDVEVALHVVERTQAAGQATVPVDGDHLAARDLIPQCGELPAVCLEPLRIEHGLESAPENPPVKQCRVLCAVPLQIGVDHFVYLFFGFIDLCEIHRLEFDAEEPELLRKQVDHPRPVCGGVSVECDDQVVLRRCFQRFREFPGEAGCRLQGSGRNGFDGFGSKYRLVDSPRVVVRVRIVHETHGLEILWVFLWIGWLVCSAVYSIGQ